MNKIQTIKALLSDGQIKQAAIEISEAPPWRLVFHDPDLGDRESTDQDLFAALLRLRRELEQSGMKLLCAGARIDVFPSGMSRAMGAGRKAYVTRLGKPATELVDIFDDATPETVGSVMQQVKFHEEWIASLRQQ